MNINDIKKVLSAIEKYQSKNASSVSVSSSNEFAEALANIIEPQEMASTASPVATTNANSQNSSWTPFWVGKYDGNSFLLQDSSSKTQKPSIKEFMDATGCDYEDATQMLYGVVGSNKEVRDWGKIMSVADPMNAARAATNAMYQNDTSITNKGAYKPQSTSVIAQSGNYAYIIEGGISRLMLADKAGNLLTEVSLYNPADIYRKSMNFGFDVRELSNIASQLQAKGISTPVNLADIANGKMGTTYDWTIDPNVQNKGLGAAERLAKDRKLAVDIGLKDSSILNEPIAVGDSDPTKYIGIGSKTPIVGYITAAAPNKMFATTQAIVASTQSNTQAVKSVSLANIQTQTLLRELLSRLASV